MGVKVRMANVECEKVERREKRKTRWRYKKEEINMREKKKKGE